MKGIAVNDTSTDIPAHPYGLDLGTKTAIEAMIKRRMRSTGETRRQVSLHLADVLRADAENTVSVYAALDRNLARLKALRDAATAAEAPTAARLDTIAGSLKDLAGERRDLTGGIAAILDIIDGMRERLS
jgi:GrpB-like predicted nucleotidyltransferase (UPF0157 family)